MAKVTIIQRTQRSLRLILGMRLPRVAEALAPFGYSHEVIDEGWRLMRAITDVQITRSETAGEAAPPFASSSELEEFASLWFPLARAALGRRFAAQERLLFHGLFEARGQRAAVSVLVFSERLEAMALGKAPFLSEGPLAWAVLNQHGLDESVRDKGFSLGRQIESPLPDTSDDRVQREEEASEALWSWTLRWSGIARASIKNKTLLHALGLSPEPRPSASLVKPDRSIEGQPPPCVHLVSEKSTSSWALATPKCGARLVPQCLESIRSYSAWDPIQNHVTVSFSRMPSARYPRVTRTE